jgi:hypothetical protein
MKRLSKPLVNRLLFCKKIISKYIKCLDLILENKNQ